MVRAARSRSTGRRWGRGPLSGDQAQLLDGLAATAEGRGVALMAIGLDAIGIDVQHKGAEGSAPFGMDPVKRPAR